MLKMKLKLLKLSTKFKLKLKLKFGNISPNWPKMDMGLRWPKLKA